MELFKMNRKMLVSLTVIELLLVGSLIVIGSGRPNYIDTSSEGVDNTCLEVCNNCDSLCEETENCKLETNEKCDESGSCAQNMQMAKNCNSDCNGSGSCSQNEQRTRRCNSGSSCSGKCIN
jgi:hypothetical protein